MAIFDPLDGPIDTWGSILTTLRTTDSANDTAASNLDSVQFLTALVSKFSLDLKGKWIDVSVKITEQFGHAVSFKDLAKFVEEQTKVANSVFGLKLFNQGNTKPEIVKKGSLRPRLCVRLRASLKVNNKIMLLQLNVFVALSHTKFINAGSFGH